MGKPNDLVKEVDEEETEAKEDGHSAKEKPSDEKGEGPEEKKHGGKVHKRARGGGMDLDGADEHRKKMPQHHPRKRGGKVPGKAAKPRMDRRARGGGLADMNPTTAAGNVSSPDYEKHGAYENGGGKGGDKSLYGSGGHRRPG